MFDIAKSAPLQRTLLYASEYDEIRRVLLHWSKEGDLVLTERSDGAMTMAAFGTFAHACRIVIPAGHVPSVALLLGYDASDVTVALERFFSCDDVYLSDLQDALDVRGIGYACAVWNGSEATYRAMECA